MRLVTHYAAMEQCLQKALLGKKGLRGIKNITIRKLICKRPAFQIPVKATSKNKFGSHNGFADFGYISTGDDSSPTILQLRLLTLSMYLQYKSSLITHPSSSIDDTALIQ